MPTSSLTIMVINIKSLVIMVTNFMAAPIGILAVKIIPVYRMLPVPDVPPRGIPGRRPDHIDAGISVIRGPSIFGAEKVMQDAIQEPITVIKDPRRIRPHRRGQGRTQGRGGIDLSLRKSRDGAEYTSSHHNH